MRFIKGMDVSMLTELESRGAVYRLNGKQTDPFELLASVGANTIRLRLWHHPYDAQGRPYGGGTNDLPTTLGLARRMAGHDLDLMLDLHYSDFWSDPKKQVKPKAWQGFDKERLQTAVYTYTKEVLHAFAHEGIPVKTIQIGNEITNGLLWPEGHIDRTADMAALLNAGIRAVRESSPDTRIILHLDYGTDNDLYRSWFGKTEPYHLDFDIIGMSYYPYWNGSLEDLLANMNDMSQRYGKEVLIAETAYGYTHESLGCQGVIFSKELAAGVPFPPTPEGQKEFLRALTHTVRQVENGKGIGFVYWEPAWLPLPDCTWSKEPGIKYVQDSGEPGNSWANQALFDRDGNALPALTALNEQ